MAEQLFREQMVPMFGLAHLQQIVDPETALQKLEFLAQNVFTHAHKPTTIISFGALSFLVLFREFKGLFKNKWWIYNIPEILIVVVVSTGKHDVSVQYFIFTQL